MNTKLYISHKEKISLSIVQAVLVDMKIECQISENRTVWRNDDELFLAEFGIKINVLNNPSNVNVSEIVAALQKKLKRIGIDLNCVYIKSKEYSGCHLHHPSYTSATSQ